MSDTGGRATRLGPGSETTEPGLSTVFRVADWTVEPAANRVRRDDKVVKLEPRVMDVLVFLAARPGQVVSRQEIETAVWSGLVVGYDTVTGAIQKLRRAFDDNPRHPAIIETLSKRGYRLVAAVAPPGKAPGHRVPADAVAAAPPARPMGPWLGGALFSGALLLAVVILAWFKPWNPAAVAPATATPPAIAVLPFDNLGGDAEQGYFADGITDDLITGLARYPDLLVIARDSTFVYRDRKLGLAEIAKRLKAGYVVHGSVRRSGDRVRINAQLVDAATGNHVWADQYDSPLEGVFETQDRITDRIVSALVVKVASGERQDLGTPHTVSPLAYDAFLLGRQRFYLYLNKDENRRARDLFRQAVDLDPGFALAYAMLAWTHAFDAMNGWAEDRDAALDQAEELATRALSITDALPVAYFVRGLAYREKGEYVKALVEAEMAARYDPNYANAQVLTATLLYYAGRPEEGLERLKRAIAINPHHPYNYTFHLGQAYFVLRRYDEAIDAFLQGLASNPASERLHVWLAAAYARAGVRDEAEWEAEQVMTLNPGFSVARMRETFPFNDPAEIEHFVQGLKSAGLN